MSAAANAMWYVPHKPDLLLLAPCDGEGPLPCPGSMFVSINHLHEAADSPAPTSAGTSSASADTASTTSSQQDSTRAEKPKAAASADSTKWRHPQATPFLTCFGDIAKQQPRVVRCACGATPCRLRGLSERTEVPHDLIPADWATKWELPGAGEDSPAPPASEGRRAKMVQMWLDCTGKAEQELPRPEGEEVPPEAEVLKAAEVMLTDYLKGRVCFHCTVPSTRMQKCGRCLQARYCSRDCQRAHWPAHKAECAAATAAAAASTPAAAAAGSAAGEGASKAESADAAASTAGAAASEGAKE